MRYLCIISLFLINSFSYAKSTLFFYEIDPFYNFSIKFNKQDYPDKKYILNPVKLSLGNYQEFKAIDFKKGISIEALKGEKIYKSFIINNVSKDTYISMDLRLVADSGTLSRSDFDLNLIPTWFQAGRSTLKSKHHKFLTHELLLKSDYNYSFKDEWKNIRGKWVYFPPVVDGVNNSTNSNSIKSYIPEADLRRVLIEFNVPENIVAGDYVVYLDVIDQVSKAKIYQLPVSIHIYDKSIDKTSKDKYDIFIFTYLSLDPEVGRKNSYINGQNYFGAFDKQKNIYTAHVKDISDHGFNALLALDWRPAYLNEALKIIKSTDLKKLGIYATVPVGKNNNVLTKETVEVFKENGFEPLFYGYDEPGCNTKLNNQIELNKEIHMYGAASINACFWDDKSIALNKGSLADRSQFDYLAFSMGSHGNDEFLDSLPVKQPVKGLKQLAYWHPHVENPIRNKLYMGYWLWASGLDGVIPHGYYFLPHISKFMSNKNKLNSNFYPLSPYNDSGMWGKPEGIYRQHSTVYPSENGIISTLQWEGVADGVTDLILISQLENLLITRDDSFDAKYMREVNILLSEIKEQALINGSADLSAEDTARYLGLMNVWKSKIKYFINLL